MSISKWQKMILILSLIVFLLNNLFDSEFFEKFYVPFYAGLRWVYSKSFFYSPIALFYPVLIILIYFFYKYCLVSIFKKKWKEASKGLFFYALSIYVSFYLLWGFNYHRKDISTRLNLKIPQIDSIYVLNEIEWVHSQLIKDRRLLKNDNDEIKEQLSGENLSKHLVEIEKNILPFFKIKPIMHSRIRALYPKGLLLVLSTAGIYIPFDLEGHYDAGLHYLQKPFVIAHEMGHAYGITNEADCNFLAYLTCTASPNAYVRYAGMLTYYRYLTSYLKYHAPYSFGKMYFERKYAIQNDLNAINNEMEKYPDLIPEIRNFIYDQFLKINGIEEGMGSYDKVVDMVAALKASKK
jgi:hypothetical protein